MQRHLGTGVSHYRKCDTQSDNVTGLCHRFGMCHGVCASDVTGLACGASDVTGLACVMASVRQMSCHVMLKLLLCQWHTQPF